MGITCGRYRFIRDRFCKLGLLIVPLLSLAVVLGLATGTNAYYLPATVSAVFLALIALMTLSIPRYVKIAPEGIEIVCVTETTIIPLSEIASVEWIDELPLRRSVPLWCMIGFGGYCGYWLSLKTFRPFKIYASRNEKALLVRRIDGCDILVAGFYVKGDFQMAARDREGITARANREEPYGSGELRPESKGVS